MFKYFKSIAILILISNSLFARLPGDTDPDFRLFRGYVYAYVVDEGGNGVSGAVIMANMNIGFGTMEQGENVIEFGTTGPTGSVYITLDILVPFSWGSPTGHYIEAMVTSGPNCASVTSSSGVSSSTSYIIWPEFTVIQDCDMDGISDELEMQIAEKFKPILHKHSYDLQADLADFEISITGSGGTSITAINTNGGESFSSTIYSVNNLHIISGYNIDSYANTQSPKKWKLNFPNNDTFRHNGAPVGQRPVYYHVYKDDNYYYVQYWLYYNMNDLRSYNQTANNTWHEGDWEHVSIKLLRSSDGNYTPQKVNFYNHYGGRTRQASQAWWSSKSNLTYTSIQQGYDANHTHLHVWVSANSHALYNRYDSVYRASVHVFGIETEDYRDNVDYSPTGYDLYFEYDLLEKMGELYSNYDISSTHGNTYYPHYYILGGKPWLAFVGRLGGFWSNAVAETISPKMPTFRLGQEWYDFTSNLSGFGNSEPFISGSFDIVNISYTSDLPAGDDIYVE